MLCRFFSPKNPDLCSNNLLSGKNEAITMAMKTIYWLVKEGVAVSKFQSLMKLIENLECPYVSTLSKPSGGLQYTSESAAWDLVKAEAAVIAATIKKKIKDSPFISILADESTDISVEKKLAICVNVIDPLTFQQSTHFAANRDLQNGSGQSIASEIISQVQEWGIPMSQVIGFGTDGANAMVGRKQGATGLLLKENPTLLNIHCVAHRLVLCMSQAANKVTYLKKFQETVTGFFYYYKSSSVRSNRIKDLQALLDEPVSKYTKVHEVRWFSYYRAIETLYRTTNSLLTFLAETSHHAGCKGQRLCGESVIVYIYVYYPLDDGHFVSGDPTEPSLSKRNLEIWMVDVSVKHAIKELQQHKDGIFDSGESETQTYLKQFLSGVKLKSGKNIFKGHVLTPGCPAYKAQCLKVKEDFINHLIGNLEERFPQDQVSVVTAFNILGMRPISFLSKLDLESWGNEELNVLLAHYSNTTLCDSEATKVEWCKLKNLVVTSAYPRDKLADLWRIIKQFHADEFPNMLKLAAMGLVLPTHTADCERIFSIQNLVKVPRRNRLSEDKLEACMVIIAEGPEPEQFDWNAALSLWKAAKVRKLYAK